MLAADRGCRRKVDTTTAEKMLRNLPTNARLMNNDLILAIYSSASF